MPEFVTHNKNCPYFKFIYLVKISIDANLYIIIIIIIVIIIIAELHLDGIIFV